MHRDQNCNRAPKPAGCTQRRWRPRCAGKSALLRSRKTTRSAQMGRKLVSAVDTSTVRHLEQRGGTDCLGLLYGRKRWPINCCEGPQWHPSVKFFPLTTTPRRRLYECTEGTTVGSVTGRVASSPLTTKTWSPLPVRNSDP